MANSAMTEITAERAIELAEFIAPNSPRGRRIGFHEYGDIAAALRKLADLMRVVGPEMPCGCYAVTMRRRWNPERFAKLGSGEYLYCGKHEAEHSVTAEYVEWRAQ